jgi:cytidylate kinase
MTREMGSRGLDVSLGLAEQLGLDLVQHEVVDHLVDKMHIRESSVNRFLEGKAGLLERWGINERDFSLYTSEEILELAERGNILIRGWGATYILRDIPHIPCIRVCAPFDDRVHVVMERVGITDQAVARKEVQRNDAAHARTMSHLFHVDYREAELYDLTFNTARLSIEECVALVRHMLDAGCFAQTSESRAMLHHRKIEAAVRSALRSNEITSQPTPSFEARYDPATGVVNLSGVAANEEYKREAEQVVGAVSGVEGVENEMIVIRPSAYGGP